MIDALATNHTSFLREPDHFDFLRQQVLPNLQARDTVEIWSAACATGEEVWTLAMLLNEAALAQPVAAFARSDISSKALAFAQTRDLSRRALPRHSAAVAGALFHGRERPPATLLGDRRRCARRPRFRRINLVEPYSWPRRFPVIFCRNVMIYFDRRDAGTAWCADGRVSGAGRISLCRTRGKPDARCSRAGICEAGGLPQAGRIEARWNK